MTKGRYEYCRHRFSAGTRETSRQTLFAAGYCDEKRLWFILYCAGESNAAAMPFK